MTERERPKDEDESCANCRFRRGQFCKRHSPVLKTDGFLASWPTVHMEWCGDWEWEEPNDD
jgi:hypothetical protein